MNERIRALAEQAGMGPWGIGNGYEPDGIVQKFSELIVRECADVVDDGFASSNFGNGITGHQLLKHFGVEE